MRSCYSPAGRYLLTAWLGLLSAIPLAAAQAPEAKAADDPRGTLVLDESCYFRHYYQLDWDAICPGPLKEEGIEKLVGERALRSLEAGVKRRLAHLNIDWGKTDWRDRAVVRFVCPNAGIQPVPEAERYMNSPTPPADWASPDFDDTRWQRQRKPFLVGRPAVGFGVQNCGVRTAYFRTRFSIPDPAKAGDLSLKITYRGGVRVLLNGKEIGRGHLPEGDIAPDAFADEYPMEAYIRRMAELEQAAKVGSDSDRRFLAAVKEEVDKTGVFPPPKYSYQHYVAEVFGPFDEARKAHGQPDVAFAWGSEGAGTGKPAYRREVWQRVRAIRERVLEIPRIPAAAIRKGDNVLAIEVHTARFHPITLGDWFGGPNMSWPHAQISYLELRATGEVPSELKRPEGMQVWVEGPQRQVHDTEWGDRAAAPRPVRFVGVPGGIYGGQIVVGTSKELTGLSAKVTELKVAQPFEAVASGQPSQAGKPVPSIPASAVSVVPMKPVKLSELSSTVGGRSKTASDPLVGANTSLIRHGPPVNVFRLPEAEKLELMHALHMFDQIGADGPRTIPAGRCQPLWVSLTVPHGTPAGVYRGSVAVTAGGQTVSVPVEAEVFAWRLGEPADYRTLMALEFSPYAVAKQYKTPLWSEEHFSKLVPTLKLLSRVGNGFVFVPVVSWTEFGNKHDSCIRWTRTKEGSLAWDYSRLDKFLDLCGEHMGKLRCVTFVVMNGNPGNPAEVVVADEATGQREVLPLQGQKISESDRRRTWGAFAVDLYNHMKARGQEKLMYWGYAWDSEGDPMLKNLLADYTPGVYWAMGGHDIRVDPRFYKVTSWIYKVYGAMSLVNNRHGWKNPALEFQNPRGGGSVLCLPGPFPAFAYRLTVDRALTVGCRGVGRVGVDYWQDTYYEGARGGEVWCQPGMPVHAVLWPGPNGAESSTRFEAMAEGVQEAEARIFIEQALDRKALPAELAEKAEKVIFDHLAATSFIPAGVPAERNIEYGAAGWQERSGRLYATAAEIAGYLKLDAAEDALAVDLVPRSKRTLSIRLRNWTGKERSFKVAADVPWIVPEAAQAAAPAGFVSFAVTLDGDAVEPGSQAKGTLTLTDASGRSFKIAVTADVSPVFTISAERIVFNVTADKSESRQFALFNASGQELAWKASSDAAWLKVSPADGKLAAASGMLVTVTAAPTADAAEGKVTISSAGAPERVIAIKGFAIPAYVAPAEPAGEAVPVEGMDMTKYLKRCRMLAVGEGTVTEKYFRTEPRFHTPQIYETYWSPRVYAKTVADALNRPLKNVWWIKPRGEAVFNVKDAGFKAFSAYVGVPQGVSADVVMNFEIHVDGKCVAQSNLMTVRDGPRLLAVTGLEKASEVMLVTRLADQFDDDRVTAFWGDAKFHR